MTVTNIVENVSLDLKMQREALLHITCTESVVQPNNFSIVVNFSSETETEVIVITYSTSVNIAFSPLLPATVYTYIVSVVDGISHSQVGWTVQGNFTTPGM